MFTPNSKIKKILAAYDSCAYIHRDGLVIWEKKEVKISGGNSTKVDIWHIIPCEIPIYVRDYTRGYGYNSDTPEVDRLVVHDPHIIANGFDSVQVDFNSCSDGSTKAGLVINQVCFTHGAHRWSDVEIVGIWGGRVAIQPNPYVSWGTTRGDKSIRAYLDYSWRSGNSVVVHGDLPEEKMEVLQLTVAE